MADGSAQARGLRAVLGQLLRKRANELPEEFTEVQAVMRFRSPQLKAPRFVTAGTLLGGVCFCADFGGAMTLRISGKGIQYRYFTCCTTARQGKTGCRGRTIPMKKLDTIVVSHLEERLLGAERLEELLAGLA